MGTPPARQDVPNRLRIHAACCPDPRACVCARVCAFVFACGKTTALAGHMNVYQLQHWHEFCECSPAPCAACTCYRIVHKHRTTKSNQRPVRRYTSNGTKSLAVPPGPELQLHKGLVKKRQYADMRHGNEAQVSHTPLCCVLCAHVWPTG